MFSAKITTAALTLLLSAGAAFAQVTPGEKVTPGNDATKAVGSQVAPMKKECPEQTASASQGQHAPTAAVGQAVPQMNAPAECPSGLAPEQKK